jgi:hypothetical protein
MLPSQSDVKGAEMSIATLPRDVAGGHSDPQKELQVELRHVQDLIFIRDLLRERGAASSELREYASVIDAARTQLAASAKRASAVYAAAA